MRCWIARAGRVRIHNGVCRFPAQPTETAGCLGSPGRIRTYSQPPPVGSATWISWQRLARAVASLHDEFQMANFRYRSAFQLGIAYTESPVPPSSRVEVAQAGRVKTMALTLA